MISLSDKIANVEGCDSLAVEDVREAVKKLRKELLYIYLDDADFDKYIDKLNEIFGEKLI